MLRRLSIGLLASAVAIAPLPLKAQDGQASEIPQIFTMVGFLAAAECFVRNGHGTQEEADEITRDTLNKNPNLKPAYTWLTTTPNGNAAIQATIPYLNPACSNFTNDEGELREAIMPFIK